MRCSNGPWTTLLGLLALCVLTVACPAEPDATPEAQTEVDPPTPNLGAHTVQHVAAEVAPTIQWRSSSIARTPMSLTAGDGSGLRLRSVTGTVVIEDPLAFTELRLTFENPEPRRREGRFEMDLPSSAALSRLAMRIGSRWMEGEVVERTRGRKTFEKFIHRRPKVDPALMEKATANRVSARIFPIQPRERKEIILSYSQPLTAGDGTLRLPLQGLPELDALDIRVIVKSADAAIRDRFPTASQRVVQVSERDFAPTQDLVVALDGSGDAAGVRSDDLVAVRVRPELLGAHDTIEGLTVLFDTSASTAHGFDKEVDRLSEFLESLANTPVRVIAFDQTVEIIHDGAARDALGDPLAGLRERRAFGASNLHAALTHTAVTEAPAARLLLWTDGVATSGPTDAAALKAAAARIPADRIDAYLPSTASDRETLAALVAGDRTAGFIVGPGLRGPVLATSLTQRGFDDVTIAVDGAQWSYPQSLASFAPGDDVVVYAQFEGQAPNTVGVAFSDARLGEHSIPVLDGAAPLVERAVGLARIAKLSADLTEQVDEEAVEQTKAQRLALALKHRVLTDQTALLVLENEGEYRRYGIDRNALADILTIGPTGVQMLRRRAGPTGQPLPSVDKLLATATEPSSTSTNTQRSRGEEGRFGTPTNGVLGQLQQDSGHFLASPHGSAFAVGSDDTDVWGGLAGTEVGEAFGIGGMGVQGDDAGGQGRRSSRGGTIGLGNVGLIGKGGGGGLGMTGTGRGGGGTGEGMIGLGNQRGIGHGVGSGYGMGSGHGFGGRGKRVPRVAIGKPEVRGGVDRDIVRRVVRSHMNEVRHCYNEGLKRNPSIKGRVSVSFVLSPAGRVPSSTVSDRTLPAPVAECIAKATKRWRFPATKTAGNVIVKIPFVLAPDGSSSVSNTSWRSPVARRTPRRRRGQPSDGPQWVGSAQSGRFATLQGLVASGRSAEARTEAWAWATAEPDNALALVALGEALEIDGRRGLAARVYGSIIDLHPQRADMRRAASARLEALGADARALAIDSYRKALAQRPDQINGHRLLAWALVKEERYDEAFTILGDALATRVPSGRFSGVKALLREDRNLIAAAWLANVGEADATARARISAAGVRPATTPSLRLVADWETDATDVDLLVDPIGAGNGRRHADVRTGFGPEAWISRGGKRPAAVTARVRYFDRGAMGYAMGTVSSIAHDGEGNLSFRDRPFVLMEATGSVELGRFSA